MNAGTVGELLGFFMFVLGVCRGWDLFRHFVTGA